MKEGEQLTLRIHRSATSPGGDEKILVAICLCPAYIIAIVILATLMGSSCFMFCTTNPNFCPFLFVTG